MVFVQTRAATTPKAPITKNTDGQPYRYVSQPVIGANIAVAKYCAELKIADAVPRSAAGNQAATIRPLPGNDGASARPSMNRSVNSATIAAVASKMPTNPWRNVNSDQVTML